MEYKILCVDDKKSNNLRSVYLASSLIEVLESHWRVIYNTRLNLGGKVTD